MNLPSWFLNFRIARLHSHADALLAEADHHRRCAQTHQEAAATYNREALITRDRADALAAGAVEAQP